MTGWHLALHLLLVACVATLASPLAAQVAEREIIQGAGQAKDGDTITVANREVRLVGIDAPETGQVCRDNSGSKFRCGNDATQALQDILSKGTLYCQTRGRGAFGRELAECWVLGERGAITNVNEVMVMAGMAFAATKFSEEYMALEALAKKQKAGLWAGEFEFPWEYRERQKPLGLREPPVVMPPSASNCPPRAPYCKEITSCSRACFLLNECGFGRLDRDQDGIPCENVCRRPCP